MAPLGLILPVALFFLGLHSEKKKAAAAPPAQKQRITAPQPPAAARMKFVKRAPAPSVPKNADEAAEQAAVNAAVATAVRKELESNAAAQGQTVPAVVVDPAAQKRAPAQAAKDLAAFLKRTGRFGTTKDRPAEVKAAQADLGLTADGLVGPRTREAARKVGVTLPPLKT